MTIPKLTRINFCEGSENEDKHRFRTSKDAAASKPRIEVVYCRERHPVFPVVCSERAVVHENR